MLFYYKKHSIQQDIGITYKYFLSKHYYSKLFSDDGEDEAYHVESQHDSKYLLDGEKFELIAKDNEIIITLEGEVLSIKENEQIQLAFYFKELIDRIEGTLDDDEEATNFISNYFGEQFTMTINISTKKGKTIVEELSHTKPKNFIAALFWKVYGWYYKITRIKKYKDLIHEIESI